MSKTLWIPDPKLAVPGMPHFHLAMQGFMKWWVIDSRDGSVVKEAPGWQPNLIVNDGMNTIGSNPRLICNCFTHAVASIGTAATAVNGAPSTIQQTGQTVTVASGGFDFNASGIVTGDSIKFDSIGADALITSVNSATNVTVNISQTVTAVGFSVYKTSQSTTTFNAANEERTSTYLTGAGNCESTLVGPVLSHKRTYDFAIRASSKAYTEVGFSWSGVVNSANTIFSRLLINGGSVTVQIGQQLRVAYQLNIWVGPSGPISRAAAVVGWPIGPATDTNGVERLQLYGMTTISSASGGTITATLFSPATIVSDDINEPASTNGVAFLSTSSTAPNAFNTDPPVRATLTTIALTTPISYVGNTFYLLKRATFAAGAGTSTGIRSFGIGSTISGKIPGTATCYVFVYGQAQTKNAGNQLVLNFKYSWSRVLA